MKKRALHLRLRALERNPAINASQPSTLLIRFGGTDRAVAIGSSGATWSRDFGETTDQFTKRVVRDNAKGGRPPLLVFS